MDKRLKFRHNAMEVTSVPAFEHVKGGIHENIRDVYFVRLLGDDGNLLRDVEEMDAHLSSAMSAGKCMYQRLLKLPGFTGWEEAEYYSGCYEHWKQEKEQNIQTKGGSQAGIPSDVLAGACQKTVQILAGSKRSFSASIEKNFVVKLLFWLDSVLEDFPQNWRQEQNMKIVSHNIVRRQEYCFFYFLTLLGMDVLLIQSRQDVEPELERLGLSRSFRLGNWSELEFSACDSEKYKKKVQSMPKSSSAPAASPAPVKITLPERARGIQASAPQQDPASVKAKLPERGGNIQTPVPQQDSAPVKVKLPERNRRHTVKGQQPCSVLAKDSQAGQPVGVRGQNFASERREKTFEELASLASSVVLVGIHDNHGRLIGTGSGIMIGRNGYILTNNHVASGGCFYTVRIEEDEKVYETEEVIKYNPVLDLAVLRIDHILKPLPVYCGGKKLVRGQKVVAIGSPLGLFNSVSDGIISGFRVIDDVDMIQFTAPISHGSSGGALLNMYGEVIGISTAGIDEGQNINLAMGYECINLFVQGFTG